MIARSTELVQRWFLGPAGTFRNAARTWIYLGFVGGFLALVAILSTLRPHV